MAHDDDDDDDVRDMTWKLLQDDRWLESFGPCVYLCDNVYVERKDYDLRVA